MNKKLLVALTCSTLFMGMTACESNDTASKAEKLKQENTQKTNDKQKKDTTEDVPVKEINTTINAGPYKYSPNGTNNEHFIIYDNAKFEDNFDGLKVYMNQLSLTNKERTSNGKNVGSLRIAFTIENTTNSTFSFSFNRMRATTDQGELFEPSTFIKQNFINPTKKIDDTQDNKIVFNDYGTKDLESIQWVDFTFEINKQSPEITIAKTQKYKIRFNIDQHYGGTTTKQEQPQTSSNTDDVTYKNEIKPKIDSMIKEFNDIWNQEVKSIFNKEGETLATINQNTLQEQMELVSTKYRELSKENINFNSSDKINDPTLKEKINKFREEFGAAVNYRENAANAILQGIRGLAPMEDRMKEARKSIKISEQKFNNASTNLTEFETKLNSK
ncbi:MULTISPECIES: ribonuclease [Bacillus]|uniref:ribonuclease n=1 Tax=Bacillus TaxID=1386 RepID=UPI000B4C01FD|nr:MULTISPECIES: ribonuclease [Bacillus cereus group]MDA1535858.1 ribonuclease [Bacillus cereus group sp. TH254-2LC]MDA1546553.1 ribonuclease [Bacillus cereus group sp. TH253LC]MDA1629724.1 ribonuclease [Bacillus cereus group sp. TH172LC]MDA1833651.1 ribonuclease [Bacillus cereus group sp. BY142LC]MDA1838422.1 ribonuclease [Bacillus cereus group sp. BY17LC]